MKRIIFLSVIVAVVTWGCKNDDPVDDCQTRFYYYQAEKIFLTEISHQGTISFYDTLSVDVINPFIARYPKIHSLSIPSNSHRVIISINSESCNETNTLFSKIKRESNVSNCNRFFISSKGYTMGIYDVFVCKLKSDFNETHLNELLNRTKTEILKADISRHYYFIRADKNSKGDALDMANEFFESGYFEFAEPDFIAYFDTHNQ